MKKSPLLIAGLVVVLGCSLSTVSYAQKKVKVIKAAPPAAPAKTTPAAESVEPDKVLYDKALDFLKHGHYTEARLNFQTLINTYPDSEYLAKAKLGTADSFYKEGGTSSMVQAIAEYKDFITFFPFLDEAPYAQMQIAMGHYRMMEKSDRDNSQAQQAEQEFQTFLLKYPQSPLTPKAEQYLRDVQEVLADGEFRIGRYYYLRARQYPAAYSAATARLMEVSERYPLYSQADQALWMLGDIYMRAKQFSKDEDDRNHWADLAEGCYDQILKNYPHSRWVSGSTSQLTSMGMTAPPPDPAAAQRMQEAQLYAKSHHSVRASLLNFPMAMVKSNPDVSLAARSGMPTLTPPDNVVSATDVLKKGAAGPNFTVTASLPPADADANGSVSDSSTPVEAVPTSGTHGASSSSIGVEIIEAPASDAAAAAAAPSAPASDTSATTPTAATTATSAAPGAASVVADPPPSSSASPSGVSGSSGDSASQASQGAAGATQPAAQPETAAKNDSSTESTSKKKKGLKKIIPF
jgi:outer membrane protein assembly factor BamD